MKLNSSIIRIVGLIGDIDKKNANRFYANLKQHKYVQECFPVTLDGNIDKGSEKFLKDYFYPDFREIMYLSKPDSINKRFVLNSNKTVSLLYKRRDFQKEYKVDVLKSEIYIFEGNLGLFSLSIKQADESLTLEDISNLLSILRNFDTQTADNLLWHEWITSNILCGVKLRGDDVKSDEYSGSKFKLFTVLDIVDNENNRSDLIYDIATTSPLGSGSGKGSFSPDPEYHQEIMKNRIGVFKNWEALCLFDSFTCIGEGQLTSQYISWDYTYFRIYLYRLFFKFNIYRYNSEIQKSDQDAVKWRSKFESFLNTYHVSHISFNFLANDIFKKTGESLDLENELQNFRDRINNLSEAIKEEKQAKTNMLLQAVTVLSGISSVGPVIDILTQVKLFLGWSTLVFYLVVSFILILLGLGILFFIMPEKIKKVWKSMKSIMG